MTRAWRPWASGRRHPGGRRQQGRVGRRTARGPSGQAPQIPLRSAPPSLEGPDRRQLPASEPGGRCRGAASTGAAGRQPRLPDLPPDRGATTPKFQRTGARTDGLAPVPEFLDRLGGQRGVRPRPVECDDRLGARHRLGCSRAARPRRPDDRPAGRGPIHGSVQDAGRTPWMAALSALRREGADAGDPLERRDRRGCGCAGGGRGAVGPAVGRAADGRRRLPRAGHGDVGDLGGGGPGARTRPRHRLRSGPSAVQALRRPSATDRVGLGGGRSGLRRRTIPPATELCDRGQRLGHNRRQLRHLPCLCRIVLVAAGQPEPGEGRADP